MKKLTLLLLSSPQPRKRFDGEFEGVVFDKIYQKVKNMIRQGHSLFILGGSLKGRDAKTVAEVIAKLKMQHLEVDFHFAGSMRLVSKDVWH